jgi:omega-6 fatty acid desaturase (delta-12 desaturase)
MKVLEARADILGVGETSARNERRNMSEASPARQNLAPDPQAWRASVAKYETPHLGRGVMQIATTLLPYFTICYLMYLSLGISYWITLALSIPAAGFLIRSFIIAHDCGHGSFFKSRKANEIVGIVTDLLLFTPYHHWRQDHAKHHATAGNLDHRGIGDIWTLTIKEYLALPFWERMKYRAYRSPWVMFTVGGFYAIVIGQRWARPWANAREVQSVHRTNFMLLLMVVGMSLLIGIKAYLLIQIPIFIISSAVGVWLFYVQHQFEGVYWDREDEWDYVTVAMEGSSFYDLPRVLHWFTGNIGYHHIHHLSPRIPNYNLARCHYENEIYRKVKHVTLLNSLKSLSYRLWDEDRHVLVGFKDAKSWREQEAA